MCAVFLRKAKYLLERFVVDDVRLLLDVMDTVPARSNA